MRSVLVLYDPKKKKYVKQPKKSNNPQVKTVLTRDVKKAQAFSESQIKQVWQYAYRLAWLNVGHFTVYTIKR